MADYRLSAQAISRSAGRSAVACAAYRAGQALADERTRLIHDYTRKGGVAHEEILAPDDAPGWAGDREALWNQVERRETRINSQVAREVQLSLPHELTHEQRVALVRDYVQENLVAQGMVADITIHAPSRDGDQRNHHAHVMLTTRRIGREGFLDKGREWNSKETLAGWREQWAVKQNQHLRQALGKSAPQVSHKSYDERGIEKIPGKHLGPAATALERRAVASRRGELHRTAQSFNERIKLAREKQDEIIARLPHEQKTLAEISFAMSRTKEGLTAERAERAAELADILKDMRGKRGHTMATVERATLEPFETEERAAARELEAARERAGVQATPKEIMKWFTDPAAALWNAAKASMREDSANSALQAARRSKSGFQEWLKTDVGKDFAKAQLGIWTNNSPEIPAAVAKVQKAQRVTDRATAWMKSDEGVAKKLTKLRELRGDLSDLRVKERRARRNIAQIDRVIRGVEQAEKLSNGLANIGVTKTISVPEHVLDTRKYVKTVQTGLANIAKTLTQTQRQTLGRVLTMGLGIGRG